MPQFSVYLSLLAVLNGFGLFSVWLDKHQSIKQGQRWPEVSFFVIASCLASAGVLLGILLFRHKTRKVYFPLGIVLIFLQQLALAYLVWLNYFN